MSKSFQSSFLNARAKTAALVMNATGWQQGVINPENITADSVFFYVFDHESKWTWCCSIPKEHFYLAIKDSTEPFGQAVANCEHLIANAAQINAKERLKLSMDMENTLAHYLSLYIKGTQVYELTGGATKQNHFAVIRYGRAASLRPFALGGPARHLLPARDIQACFARVVATDSSRHPEWV